MKFFLILLVVVFVSCGKETRLQKMINETDVVKVYVYGSGSVPILHYEVNNIEKIKEWKNYISEKDATTGNCNMEGKLIFKVYEDSTVMKFSLKPGCQYVNYAAGDSTFNKQLTPKGISFIQGLMKVQ